jgi:signal transduction histidine kinase
VVLETLMSDHLSLRILDNGVGFDAENRPPLGPGLGLRMIKEHAETVLGHAHVRSRPGAGTVVEIVVPLGATQTAVELPSALVENSPKRQAARKTRP